MSLGIARKANSLGRGALERGHGAPLEPLAQLGDALRSVGAFAHCVEAAELVCSQTANVGRGVSMGVDRGDERPVRGARAPQGSDLCVLEHGSDCLATVDADVVVAETARGDQDYKCVNGR